MADTFNKVTAIDDVLDHIQDGMSIMIGGFLGVGAPLRLIDKLVASGKKNLTIITTVCSYPGGGFDIGKLIENHQVRKIIASHTGTTPAINQQYLAGELELEWYPMGSFAEKIRCGGGGLGGVLTPVGIGTLVEEGKQKIQINGKDYLLETPLHADVALINGFRGDKMGNIEYRMTGITLNPIMATAADYVVAEVNEIVETGQIDPYHVHTPGIYVHGVVQGYTLEQRQKVFDDLWVKGQKFA
ncbi:CoA transferase subunit A [Desulfitobacterium sp. AusDCA]|uniref:CoA transferase subunit A n=1 Tax=Desulfitobacterium sp. AusDCA TaxID=3240383 RepID=UPI003DA6F3E2